MSKSYRPYSDAPNTKCSWHKILWPGNQGAPGLLNKKKENIPVLLNNPLHHASCYIIQIRSAFRKAEFSKLLPHQLQTISHRLP